jgi:hypothetical protein
MAKLKTQFNDLVSAPTEPTFEQEVSVSVEAYGTADFSQYEGYTINILIEGTADDETSIKLPNTCKAIITHDDWDGGWVKETNTLKNVLNLVVHVKSNVEAYVNQYRFSSVVVIKINGLATAYIV